MSKSNFRKIFTVIGAFFCLWVTFRYLLLLFLPFLLGGFLSASAEPIVNFLQKKLRLPRIFSSLAGITAGIAMILLVLLLAGGLAFRELQGLSGVLPGLAQQVQNGLFSAREQMLALARQAPGEAAPLLEKTVSDLFSGSSTLLRSVGNALLNFLTGILGRLPGGAVGLGTGILSGYLISLRLPKIRCWADSRIPASWRQQVLPGLRELGRTLGCWGKAQLKLAALTFSIVCTGFFLLKIPCAPLLALGTAAVDAIPMLGTGTVLIPGAVILFLVGRKAAALGLLGIWGTAALTRSVLEPKLLGHHLGLDPLVTLGAMYLGFRLWGVTGMIFAPVGAVAAIRLAALVPSGEASGPKRKNP